MRGERSRDREGIMLHSGARREDGINTIIKEYLP